MHIERFSEEEFMHLDLTKDSVFNRFNWVRFCNANNSNELIFEYSTWKWGKLYYLISKAVNNKRYL